MKIHLSTKLLTPIDTGSAWGVLNVHGTAGWSGFVRKPCWDTVVYLHRAAKDSVSKAIKFVTKCTFDVSAFLTIPK